MASRSSEVNFTKNYTLLYLFTFTTTTTTATATTTAAAATAATTTTATTTTTTTSTTTIIIIVVVVQWRIQNLRMGGGYRATYARVEVWGGNPSPLGVGVESREEVVPL